MQVIRRHVIELVFDGNHKVTNTFSSEKEANQYLAHVSEVASQSFKGALPRELVVPSHVGGVPKATQPVERLKELFYEGYDNLAIASLLNKEGFHTEKGLEFTYNRVAQVLTQLGLRRTGNKGAFYSRAEAEAKGSHIQTGVILTPIGARNGN